MNSILNTLDGVQTKGNDITVLFTTNHEKKINPALRRPGRIDLIVRFTNPDDETKRKIYETLLMNADGAATLDYDLIVEKTPAVQGAVIAQICKRALKLADRDKFINTDTVLAAIASMEYQIAFMKEDVEVVNQDKALLDNLTNRIADAVSSHNKVDRVASDVSVIRRAVA